MRFVVSRASFAKDPDKKPCAGAKRGKIGILYEAFGENGTVEDVLREVPVWTVELESLGDAIRFMEGPGEGRIALSKPIFANSEGLLEIEILDE